jgi:hypothetical protein
VVVVGARHVGSWRRRWRTRRRISDAHTRMSTTSNQHQHHRVVVWRRFRHHRAGRTSITPCPRSPTNKKHATGLAAFPGDGRKSERSRMIQMLLLLMETIMIPHLSTAPRVRPRGRRATHDSPLPALPHTSRTTSSTSAAGSSAPYLQKQAETSVSASGDVRAFCTERKTGHSFLKAKQSTTHQRPPPCSSPVSARCCFRRTASCRSADSTFVDKGV